MPGEPIGFYTEYLLKTAEAFKTHANVRKTHENGTPMSGRGRRGPLVT